MGQGTRALRVRSLVPLGTSSEAGEPQPAGLGSVEGRIVAERTGSSRPLHVRLVSHLIRATNPPGIIVLGSSSSYSLSAMPTTTPRRFTLDDSK